MKDPTERYRALGLKLTPQRMAIFHFLEGNESHPSAEDIYEAVRRKYPTMSFATVYNTMETLKQERYVRELTIDPTRKRFDPNTAPHHHLVCVRCKKIVDIHRPFDLNLTDLEREGFQILDHHIEFSGLCPKCKKRP